MARKDKKFKNSRIAQNTPKMLLEVENIFIFIPFIRILQIILKNLIMCIYIIRPTCCADSVISVQVLCLLNIGILLSS